MASKPVSHLQAVIDVPPIASDARAAVAALATVPVGENFKITPTGLVVIGEPTYEACADFSEVLRTFERSIQFVIGDYCRYLEGRFGEKASQIIDATGWSLSTIKTYIWVSENVLPENRRIEQGLSFKHHMAVASLPPEQQRSWLAKALNEAEEEPWPASRLVAAIKNGADVETSGWVIFVTCTSEKQQTRVLKLLEVEGVQCKAVSKRKGEKTEKDE
jgi:hypothetical protein